MSNSRNYNIAPLLSVCLLIFSIILQFSTFSRLASAASIHEAAEKGEIDKVKSLIASGEDVNARDEYGLTPLHYATAHAKLILVPAKNSTGMPKGYTSYEQVPKGDLDLVKFLVSKGADVNAKDSVGKTPLHMSASLGTIEVSKFLVYKGAAVNQKDNHGLTSLDYANMMSHQEAVQFFKKVGNRKPKKFAYDQTVLQAQKKLKELGYDPGRIDGIWGRKTERAVRRFQEDYGLLITGRLDEQTRKKLHSQKATRDQATRSLDERTKINEMINDYLIISLFALNTSRKEMDELAWPIIRKHNLDEARMKSPVTADNFEMILTSWGFALRFGSNWVDPIPLIIDRRGDFPEISFRNGAVGPRSKGSAFTINIGEGLEAKLGEKIWKFQNQKWTITGN